MSKASLQFKVTLKQMAEGLQVELDNRVSEFNPSLFPGLARGMVLQSINDTVVAHRTDTREEMARLNSSPQTAHAPVVLTFKGASGAGGLSEAKRRKDEFDFESDEGEDKGRGKKAETGGEIAKLMDGRDAVIAAVNKTKPADCIILLYSGYNPAYQVECAAESMKIAVMHIDAVARVKSRLPIQQFGSIIRKSLEHGVWMYIENASKSITLLEKLRDCIDEARKDTTHKIHENARIFLLTEPHPHFPTELIEGSVTMRIDKDHEEQKEGALVETFKDNSTKLDLIKGNMEDESLPVKMNTTKRSVKIASDVKVVSIETSAFLEMSASAAPAPETATGPGLKRYAKYRFGPSEKLISLCSVGEDRFAVGTSSGYVVVLDRNGLPLMQYRPHKACIWDVAFASNHDFSTASEDGTSSIFTYKVHTQSLEATSVASFQSDVFAISYTKPDEPSSAVLSGGLSATICVLHSDRKSSSFISASTSIQAMRPITTRGFVLFGGGNGCCALVDPVACTTVETATKHDRKVPAVSAWMNTALSGSFDKKLRVWDVRAGMHCSHNLVMADVLTATCISDNYAAACSGSSLYLWDLRNIQQILAVKNKAWVGLTRGLVMDHNTKLIVTASVDGIARFWNFE